MATHSTCNNKTEYKGKSYRMFTEWLVEAYYLRLFLQLSRIPHYTTLEKFTDRINIMLLEKLISSFILFTGIRHIFTRIDLTGFKKTHTSEYYIDRVKLKRRKKYAKLSIGADVLKQNFVYCRLIQNRRRNIWLIIKFVYQYLIAWV